MDSFLLAHKKEFDVIVLHAQSEFAQLRTGRATPAMVEGLMVEAYGAKAALKSLAAITCPEPRTILISPWDPGILKDIERALGINGMNAAASTDGVRVSLPLPTEEHRVAMVKILKEKVEAQRVKLRQLRDKIRESIQSKAKTKELTEDDKHRLLKELDLEIKKLTDNLDGLAKKKEQEIMTV